MIKQIWISLALLATLIAPAQAAFLWGANGHPFYAYPGTSIKEQFDLLADLGMKSYRVNISGMDKADELAAVVAEGKKHGIAVLPVITPGGLDSDDPKVLYQRAFDLAVGLISRFKGDIRIWELGNEPENPTLIKPCEMRDDGTQYPCNWGTASGRDVLDYYGPRWKQASAILKGLSDGAISVDPTILKAMGTAGWGHIGAFERMKNDGIRWDISVWHIYGQDPEWAFKRLAEYGHPIWITEFNNPYGSQRGDEEQAKGLKSMMARLKELAPTYKVQAAFVYELMDEPYWAPDYEAYMGLVRVVPKPEDGWMTGEPKPAYAAARALIRGEERSIPAVQCRLDNAGRGDDPIDMRRVRYTYCMVLGTQPDAAELAEWSGRLEGGKAKITDLIEAMFRTNAFYDRYSSFGMPDRTYVSFLYKLLLNRVADNDGRNSYMKQLASGTMTRKDVAVGLATSSEFRSKHPGLFTNNSKMGPATGQAATGE
ncbi:DUF4214 domain-containing protein [Mesorhizobium koreense]|jgi:hypothetical protein|uniref:DUF4214 domain-containing protein n=1 Tax=Mesorhizobium koreense TaxID=3074855 RepID=UPI00287BAE90|nr:DUF4214 domain-containing protein [Mesorhizobium sp. WR6]